MKFKSAIFTAFDVAGCDGEVRVVFQKDAKGRPLEVKVHLPGGTVEMYSNVGGQRTAVTSCVITPSVSG